MPSHPSSASGWLETTWKADRRQSSLTLGTVQLGVDYGVANRTGKPSLEEAITIVRVALAHGVTGFDCARGYGDAEERLGIALHEVSDAEVVTKLDPLTTLPPDAPTSVAVQAVDESIRRSRDALRLPALPVLLLHRWGHRHAHGDAIWRRLLELKAEGLIQRLGASVSTPDEAKDALGDPDVSHLQLPFNLLDWRWKASGVDALAIHRQDVVIHARSALLQGLLAHGESVWPTLDGVNPLRWVRELERVTQHLGRKSIPDLCFAYVRSQPWITSVVVGVDTVAQLESNLSLFSEPKLTPQQCREVEERLSGAPEHLLNPALWPKKS